MLKFFFTFVIAIWSLHSFAFDHEHTAFTKILKEYVVWDGAQSLVKYKKLKRNKPTLNAYTKTLTDVTPAEFKQFNKDQQLAFLINAYNAFTLQLILNHYPVDSIKDIGGLFSSAWKKKFFRLLGEKTHLDHIEHDLIRPKFNEPRIHFAVNCASIGCPSLVDEAFVATKLEQQLEKASKHFLTNKKKNRFNKPNLYLSAIFKWYGSDFVKKHGSVDKFVSKYIGSEEQARFIASERSVKDYLDYDWKLNESI